MVRSNHKSTGNGQRLTVLALLVLLLSARATAAPRLDDAKKPDAGAFILTSQGERLGTSKFKFDAEGGSEATNSVDVMGQQIAFTVTVKMKAAKVIAVGADAGSANHFSATFEGSKAKVVINDGGADSQTILAGAAPFGNYSPHLMHYVLGSYDAKKGGSQAVTMLMIEGLPGGQFASIAGKLTAKGTADITVAGKPLSVTTYVLVIEAGGAEIDMSVLADANRRVLAWTVPSQRYAAVREGFESVVKTVK